MHVLKEFINRFYIEIEFFFSSAAETKKKSPTIALKWLT